MSKLIKLAISAALLTATSVNAAHESPWIFPNSSNGVATTDDGVKGRTGPVTVHQPQSWIDNNEFPRGNDWPVGLESPIFAQAQPWTHG